MLLNTNSIQPGGDGCSKYSDYTCEVLKRQLRQVKKVLDSLEKWYNYNKFIGDWIGIVSFKWTKIILTLLNDIKYIV